MDDTPEFRRILGSCHCGNIRFTFDWPAAQHTIAARACGCAHCRKHAGVWTSHPQGRFQLQVTDPARTTVYRFGTKTADFHVCANCGGVPIVTCDLDGARFAVLNVNTFDNVERSQISVSPSRFDGETTQARLARRRRNWTP